MSPKVLILTSTTILRLQCWHDCYLAVTEIQPTKNRFWDNIIDNKSKRPFTYSSIQFKQKNYTTLVIHKSYTCHPSGLFSIISHVTISVISLQNLFFILSMSFCLSNEMNITWQLEDMNFISLHQKQYFTHLLRLFIKYCFANQKLNSYLRATV